MIVKRICSVKKSQTPQISVEHIKFYLSPINDYPGTQKFSAISLSLLPLLLLFFFVHFRVCSHEIFHLQWAKVWWSRFFFLLVAMVNHVICVPLIRLWVSFWGSWSQPSLNEFSELENSEFSFGLRVLETRCLKQAPASCLPSRVNTLSWWWSYTHTHTHIAELLLLLLSYCSVSNFTHIHILSSISYRIVNLCMHESSKKLSLVHKGSLGTLCSVVSFFSTHFFSLMPTEVTLGPLPTYVTVPQPPSYIM